LGSFSITLFNIFLIFFYNFSYTHGRKEKKKKKKKSGWNTGYFLHPFSTLTCLNTGSPTTSRQQRYYVPCLPVSHKGFTIQLSVYRLPLIWSPQHDPKFLIFLYYFLRVNPLSLVAKVGAFLGVDKRFVGGLIICTSSRAHW
jgi:hypothetical protein